MKSRLGLFLMEMVASVAAPSHLHTFELIQPVIFFFGRI